MKKHFLLLISLLILLGCNSTQPDLTPQLNLQDATAQPEFTISSAPISDFVYDPAQQTITVYGDLVDGCTQFESIKGEQDADSITIDVLVNRERNRDCIQALEPFEATYQLDGTLKDGDTVTVNVNDLAREITIGR